MLKTNKPVPETDGVANKLRESSIADDDKPDTVNADLGSPITPLQTRPSGLTTSSCSSSSSGSVTGRPGHTLVTRKPDSPRSNPSAAQSGSATAQASKSSTTSAAAAQSKSSSKSSKSGSPATAQPGPISPSAAKTSSTKNATGNQRTGRGRSTCTPQQPVKILPAGNLFPSGKVQLTGMTQGVPRSMRIGKGTTSYGYGSIIRGSSFTPTAAASLVTSSSSSTITPELDTLSKKVLTRKDPPELVKNMGNEMFNRGCYTEALKLYERAIELSPANPTYRSNRAAALSALDRIGEAVIECEKAIKLDPNYARAHQRLGSLLLRLGLVKNAGIHLFKVEVPTDRRLLDMFEQVDKRLHKCEEARRRGDWNTVLIETCGAIGSGADFSPQLQLCKVEALRRLKQLAAAQTELTSVPKVEPFPASFSHARFFDMPCEAYTSFVKAQMDLALGRFENAVTAAEKASVIDQQNSEIETFYRNVRLIVKARDRGKNLYESERYTEAGAAYAEGLKYDPWNTTLLCHRAECFFNVGKWESSIEDCSHALNIQSCYKKPRLLRAAAYTKLERWAEAVSDYEKLREELPYDKEIAESLFHAQVALKRSQGEVVLNMEFGCEVEEVASLKELRAALTRPGVSVVLFYRASDQQCMEMSAFMDALCIRYLSLHFLKVEMDKFPELIDAEILTVVPTFKIYKHQIRMKVIVCPTKEALENLVKNYSL